MNNINQFPEPSMNMQQRNLTQNQQKNMSQTKEGLMVNAFIKEPSMKDTYDSLLISNHADLPQSLFEKNEKEATPNQKIFKIAGITLGAMATVFLTTLFMKNNTANHLKMVKKPLEQLPFLQRNVAINDEVHHAVYQLVQTPNQKTIIGALGIFVLSAMGFVGKNMMDGFKEVFVKKKEADISKNLQEKLINVETKTFSGKNQIVRNMLSEKAEYFKQFIDIKNPVKDTPFYSFHNFKKLSFKGYDNKKDRKSKLPLYFGVVGGFIGTIALGLFAFKNLSKSAKNVEDYKKEITKVMKNIINQDEASKTDKTNLQNMFLSIGVKKEDVKEYLKNLKWNNVDKTAFEKETITLVSKSSQDVAEAIGGKGIPKPSFYSHIDDFRAHFYNWILNINNPMFRNLFLGVTTVTGLAYSGQKFVEGVKEVEVKKYGAEIELDLQKRLVGTELRNFKSKKDAAIKPLMDNFNQKLKEKSNKQELLTCANGILTEIKNGPPFIYS